MIQRERLKAPQTKPVQSKRAISKINNDYRNQAHNSNTIFRFNKNLIKQFTNSKDVLCMVVRNVLVLIVLIL
jgi:hypothetical protein